MRTLLSNELTEIKIIKEIQKSIANPQRGDKPWSRIPCSKSVFYKYRKYYKDGVIFDKEVISKRKTNEKYRDPENEEAKGYVKRFDVKRDRKREFQINHPQKIDNVKELTSYIIQCIIAKPQNGISLIMNLLRDKCADAKIPCKISRRTVHKILIHLGLNTKEERIKYANKNS